MRAWLGLLASIPVLAAASPVSAQDIPNFGKVVLCKQVTDGAERLKCYDQAVSEAPNEFVSKDAKVTAEGDWKVTELSSPIDGTPRVAAVLESTQSNSALVIRCRDHATEAYISVRTYIGTSEALPIVYRIDDAPPIDTRWLASRDGSALFLANPTLALTFIRSLPVDGTLRVRVSDFQGRSDEFTYVLGPVDEIRTRIGSACNWPADQREPEPVAQQQAVVAPTAPAPARPQQPARRRSTIKVVSVPMHQQRWNISAQRR